jgi:hypothetical protein
MMGIVAELVVDARIYPEGEQQAALVAVIEEMAERHGVEPVVVADWAIRFVVERAVRPVLALRR